MYHQDRLVGESSELFDLARLRRKVDRIVFGLNEDWMTMETVDCVVLRAYDVLGSRVLEHRYPQAHWYGQSISIVDDAVERASRGISRIDAEQFDDLGRLEVRWTATYAPDGSLAEAFERRSDEPLPDQDWSKILLGRLRWVAREYPGRGISRKQA